MKLAQRPFGATPSSPVDHLALRRHNLGLVLRNLRDGGPRSRARIADETGLTKATVSSLVAELVDSGLARAGGIERGSVGRPGHAVELDGRNVFGLGAEVNVSHVAAAALNLRGDVVAQRRLPSDSVRLRPDEVLDHLSVIIAETLAAAAASGGAPVGIAVGVAGLVDSEAGMLTVGPNLGWKDVSVRDLMLERLGQPPYPLLVDNEANLAAIAEAASVRLAPRDDLLVLVGEAGLGGGIVSGGRLLRGAQGFAGEVGHMTVEPRGRPCACGRTGCWETVVGLRALLTLAADPDDPIQDPALSAEGRLAELNRRAELGDSRTLSALDEVGRWVGVGLATLAHVLNPGAMVLSGYFAVVGSWMLDAISSELSAGVMDAHADGCRVILSQLGFDAAVRGAAQVALDAIFDDPTIVRGQYSSVGTRPNGGDHR